ncbi:MAG: hypothetical protein JJ956_09495 [Pseudomonadales bacterium]|nr:hypothetical protein [Pseudomonadales bacterium]
MTDNKKTNNECMHPVGEDRAWSESYYFNFVDPDKKIGMFTRMGFRPNNGWADALHVIYLGGKRVAFTYGRRDIGKDLSIYDGDLCAGNLTLTCQDPHQKWRIHYEGPAQDIENAEILLTRSKERPDGWFNPETLEMDLTFDCITEPHYAASGERGHFEQSGKVSGSIQIGGETFDVHGFGVRDKSWGPRDWGASTSSDRSSSGESTDITGRPTPFVNWFSMNFGDYAALGGSCFRHKDGVMRGEGWIQRDGQSGALKNVVITTDYESDSILHKNVVLTGEVEGGEKISISGVVTCVCPTKIPMPGGATFVNEGLAQFTWGDRTGYGIAEHWHAVQL